MSIEKLYGGKNSSIFDYKNDFHEYFNILTSYCIIITMKIDELIIIFAITNYHVGQLNSQTHRAINDPSFHNIK